MNITTKRTPANGIQIFADGEYITSVKYIPTHEKFVSYITKLKEDEDGRTHCPKFNECNNKLKSADCDDQMADEFYCFVKDSDALTTDHLTKIHPTLTQAGAESLLQFAKEKTITHKECYGDGSIIYPQWVEA